MLIFPYKENLNPGGISVINYVADIRYKQQKSLSQVSRLSGVSKAHIGKIERGEREPTVLVAYAICRALDRTIYEVFPDE